MISQLPATKTNLKSFIDRTSERSLLNSQINLQLTLTNCFIYLCTFFFISDYIESKLRKLFNLPMSFEGMKKKYFKVL